MNRKTATSSRACWLTSAALTLLVTVGCGDDGPRRVAVHGAVTVDGHDLPKGFIVFIPTNGTKGPKAGGTIENGNFAIEEHNGPMIGDLRVEIVEEQDLGFELDDPEAFNAKVKNGRLPKNRIPSQYNSNSTLVRTTTVEGPNEFSFELKTK